MAPPQFHRVDHIRAQVAAQQNAAPDQRHLLGVSRREVSGELVAHHHGIVETQFDDRTRFGGDTVAVIVAQTGEPLGAIVQQRRQQHLGRREQLHRAVDVDRNIVVGQKNVRHQLGVARAPYRVGRQSRWQVAHLPGIGAQRRIADEGDEVESAGGPHLLFGQTIAGTV
jgi:hypothetical protein